MNKTKTFEELGIKVIGLDSCLKEMDKEDKEVHEYVEYSQLKDAEYWLFKNENYLR